MRLLSLFCSLVLMAASSTSAADPQPLKLGMIGLDTSHVLAFSKAFNAADKPEKYAGVTIVAAYPGGSPDISASADRVAGFTKQVSERGVEIVDSIADLLSKVDGVLLTSVDGRPHYAQAEPVIKAGKPMFIDKPLAGSLADVLRLYDLAEAEGVPIWSSSSLRYSPGIRNVLDDPELGAIKGCVAFSPCSLEPHHPDLFWYGIHGVEVLYTVMGPGCETVQRTSTDGADLATGVWKDGRIGTFRGIRDGKADYGAFVFGEKGIRLSGRYGGYEPLTDQIAVFFATNKPPIPAEETIELYAFMEAADESKRQGGKPVRIADVIEAARKSIAGE